MKYIILMATIILFGCTHDPNNKDTKPKKTHDATEYHIDYSINVELSNYRDSAMPGDTTRKWESVSVVIQGLGNMGYTEDHWFLFEITGYQGNQLCYKGYWSFDRYLTTPYLPYHGEVMSCDTMLLNFNTPAVSGMPRTIYARIITGDELLDLTNHTYTDSDTSNNTDSVFFYPLPSPKGNG